MLERAGLDVQQGNKVLTKVSNNSVFMLNLSSTHFL